MRLATEAQLTDTLTELAELLILNNFKMATAESCTGGWVAKASTDIEGSSNWFDRGLVTYSNDAKQELLGVSSRTLEQNGAVSKETVIEMVDGLLLFDAVSIAVAISGIAGPGGGSDEKPVGTVWIAWKQRGQTSLSHRYLYTGNREQVRLQASIDAVLGLTRLLKSDQ
ncbi:MAG: nicotinamide-nucleotide amidohydrolase family protein [Gammaproteobacteria bacterium]|nr:nicotinamide-nucleotide amidohydrolase family protein [Gammaproteobacteria bacterium]